MKEVGDWKNPIMLFLQSQDLKHTMKRRPCENADIKQNSDIILDEQQHTWPVNGYCPLF